MKAQIVEQIELFSEAELESLEFTPEELEAIEEERVPDLDSISFEDIAEDLEAIFMSFEDISEAKLEGFFSKVFSKLIPGRRRRREQERREQERREQERRLRREWADRRREQERREREQQRREQQERRLRREREQQRREQRERRRLRLGSATASSSRRDSLSSPSQSGPSFGSSSGPSSGPSSRS